MAQEGKRGGFFSGFLIVVFAAASIVFAIMYFSQKTNYEETRKMLSDSKDKADSVLSEIGDLRMRLNVAEDKRQKLEAAAGPSKDYASIKYKTPLFGVPADRLIIVCAETFDMEKIYCTQNGGDYVLEVPAGEYYIFARNIPYPLLLDNQKNVRNNEFVYYTKKSKCAEEGRDWRAEKDCTSDKVLLKVEAGQKVENISFEDINFLEKESEKAD